MAETYTVDLSLSRLQFSREGKYAIASYFNGSLHLYAGLANVPYFKPLFGGVQIPRGS